MVKMILWYHADKQSDGNWVHVDKEAKAIRVMFGTILCIFTIC